MYLYKRISGWMARVILVFASLVFFLGFSHAQSGSWVWMNGSSRSLQNSVYGTTGVPSSQNTPGSRFAASSWTDKSGNLWLFGGEQGSFSLGMGKKLNELWKYDRVSHQWTFIKGDKTDTATVPGVYGTKGVTDAANHPGGRNGAALWMDSNGDIWVFGGWGYDATGQVQGRLNDLWKLDGTTLNWTWMGGNGTLFPGDGQVGVYGTKGIADPANLPGGRTQAATWVDRAGNLWLFGGTGLTTSSATPDYLNDLWKYDIASGQWTWVAGSDQLHQNGTYGTLGVSAAGNNPGGRQGPRGWVDKNGDFLVFAGMGLDSVGTDSYMNDLWKFSPASSQWTWVGGSNAYPFLATYGTSGMPSGANIPGGRLGYAMGTDADGNVFLFGGIGVDSLGHAGFLDDLWKFDNSSGEWMWLGPSSLNEIKGVYGSLGVSSSGNQPGSRTLANLWVDERETVWLFGGVGRDSQDILYSETALNDLWAFDPVTATPTITPNGGTFDGHVVVGIDDATPNARIYVTSDGSEPTTSSPLYSGPLTISTTQTLKAMAAADGYLPSDAAGATFTINQPDIRLAGTNVSVVAGVASGNVSEVTVTPVHGFTGTVMLTAALTSTPQGATKLPTLSFGSTGSVAITSAAAQTASLTIDTVAPIAASLNARPDRPWLPAGGTALSCILLFGLCKRSRRFLKHVAGLILLVALAHCVSGCGGGGGGTKTGGGQSTPGTTAGNYTITVTATSGALVRTATVALTVK